MRNKNAIIASAIAGLLSIATSSPVVADTAASNQEKCYGISKAGSNDCASGKNSCAGSAVKDNQADAFIFLPKGLCERITGGNLKSDNATSTKS